VVTEQEIKEQIERDGESYSRKRAIQGIPDNDFVNYMDGAENQDKIATNRTVEAAIQIILKHASPTFEEIKILEELEKLRR